MAYSDKPIKITHAQWILRVFLLVPVKFGTARLVLQWGLALLWETTESTCTLRLKGAVKENIHSVKWISHVFLVSIQLSWPKRPWIPTVRIFFEDLWYKTDRVAISIGEWVYLGYKQCYLFPMLITLLHKFKYRVDVFDRRKIMPF